MTPRLGLGLGLRQGGGSGVRQPLAFHALTSGFSSQEMLGVRRGTGSLTEARTSTIYQPDWENIWRSYGSGEPAYRDGRKVENLAFPSNDFSNASWVKQANVNIIGTVAGPGGAGPSTGYEIEWAGAGNNNGLYRLSLVADLTPNGHMFSRSLWIKGSSSGNVTLTDPHDSSNEASIAVTTTWQRLSAAFLNPLVDSGIWIQKDTSAPASPSTIYIAGAQMEEVSGQADQTPSEYIPTTTAVASKIFATDRSGVALSDLPWLYGGPAGTNSITYSRDLTNAAWTKVGGVINSYDQVGLTGAANTATYLEDDDGAAYEYVSETITVPADTNLNIARWFVKKDTDETRFPFFGMDIGAVAAYYHVNTKTGATSAEGTPAAGGAIEVNQVGDWWEVLVSLTNDGSTNQVIYAIPARSTVIGTASVAATGSIIVGNVELHLNKTIAQVRGSTPIFTAGSTVSVNATDLSFDDANHSDTEGAYYLEFKNVGLNASNKGGLIGLGVNGRLLFNLAAADFRAYDGTTSIIGPTITLAADDTEYKIGLAYGSSLARTNVDDAWGTEAAYDGAFDNANSKLAVLRRNNTDLFDPPAVMLMRNLRRYDLSYADAQTKINELMS